MSELFELIREDFAAANEVWKKSDVLLGCLSFIEEEEDEEGEAAEVQYSCRLSCGYVDGRSAIVLLGAKINKISHALHSDRSEALKDVESMIFDLGGAVEFIEANSHKLECGEYESVDAVDFLNDMIFCLERVKGNLRALACR